MIYLKCIQDCFMDNRERCFTNGLRYRIISGSPQDMGGVELWDDQGSSHFVSGEWVERFLIMAPSMEMDGLFFDPSVSGLEDRRKEAEECKLWEEDETDKIWSVPTASQIWERDSDYPSL